MASFVPAPLPTTVPGGSIANDSLPPYSATMLSASRGAQQDYAKWIPSGGLGPVDWGNGLNVGGAVAPTTAYAQPFVQTATGLGTTALATGDVLELAGWFLPNAFAVLDSNQLLAVGFAAATTQDCTNSGITRRITLGVSSNGSIHFSAATGAAISTSNTGVVAVAGTWFKFRIVWTVGTSALLYIDDVLVGTRATSLPTYVNTIAAGVGSDAGAAQRDFNLWGVAWRYTPA